MTRLSRSPVPPTRLWDVGLPRAWHLALGTWSTWKILPVSAGLASTLRAQQAGCVLGTRAAAACAAGEATTPRAAWWLSPATARCSGAAMWSASSAHSRSWCIPASARPPPGETVVLPGLLPHKTPASTYLSMHRLCTRVFPSSLFPQQIVGLPSAFLTIQQRETKPCL
ncbi:hypothetical protein LEMLEM_LOCUS27564 [Lemmus lemmus]